MSKPEIKKIGILANLKKPNAIKEIKKLMKFLSQCKLEFQLSEDIAKEINYTKKAVPLNRLSQNTDLIVVFGGDGTLLWGARSGAFGQKPVIGVNLGTLGFLVNTSPEELYPLFKYIVSHGFKTEKRMMLEAEIHRIQSNKSESGKPEIIWKKASLNDAVISKETLARMIQLRIRVNSQLVTEYNADGLIIATPTGSTAHSLSAGGPIVHPTTDVIILTPICPHTLSNRPLIIQGMNKIEIEILTREQNTFLTLDGQDGYSLKAADKIILHKSNKFLRLVLNPHRDYFDILQEKLHWGQRLKLGDRR